MYPMHDMIRGRIFVAPPADPSLSQDPPQMHLVAAKLITSPHGSSSKNMSSPSSIQLDLELRLPRPAVGVLNVTGSVQSWLQGAFPDPIGQVKLILYCLRHNLEKSSQAVG